MELVKPDPLIIGGKPHYTLTSYEPVSIEVRVRQVTDEDVAYAMQLSVMQAGGGPAQLYDDAWIQQQFPGIANANELRVAMRDQLKSANSQLAEEQKAAECANALAKRLVQRVPQYQVEQARQFIEQAVQSSLSAEGVDTQAFLAQSGMRQSDYQLMIEQQAQTTAEHEAALSAWADKYNIRVADDEIAAYLGAPPEEAEEFMGELRAAGRLEDARAAARQNKTMEAVIAECSCTYRHETPAEASARVKLMQAEQSAFMQQMQRQGNDQDNRGDSGPRLKLV